MSKLSATNIALMVIGRYERGEMVPSVEVAKKLADAFDTTLDYLG